MGNYFQEPKHDYRKCQWRKKYTLKTQKKDENDLKEVFKDVLDGDITKMQELTNYK